MFKTKKMRSTPYRQYFASMFKTPQPLTIKRIWFGNGGETDETFTIGEHYGRNENYIITKIVETASNRARIYSNDVVSCDILNVTKIDYV